ncbi:hypothetical protein FOZ63_012844, partial [Perkinsus olseni]
MIFSRLYAAALLTVPSTLALGTASQSEVNSLRGDIGRLSQRIDTLETVVGRLISVKEAANLGDVSNMDRGVPADGVCVLKRKKGSSEVHNTLSVYFDERLPNPIRYTTYSRISNEPKFISGIGYDADFTEFRVQNTNRRIDLKINDLERAHRHFRSLMPFDDLEGEVLQQLRSLMPITTKNSGKCEEVFTLLANNPPSDDYVKGAQWFDDFYLTSLRSLRTLKDSWGMQNY